MLRSLTPSIECYQRDFSIVAVCVAASCLWVSGCQKTPPAARQIHKVVTTRSQLRSVDLAEQYACQIQASRHVEIRPPEKGMLKTLAVNEGQTVQEGDLLCVIAPTSEPISLPSTGIQVTAPFEGLVGQFQRQAGGFVERGDVITTLSDCSTAWVYFNVPEARFLDYQAEKNLQQDARIELVLSGGDAFPETGKIAAIAADFNVETGAIGFRADFPNPGGLLRHGQRGNVIVHHEQPDALVIPRQAAFELLHQHFVYVVDKANIVHRQEIEIQREVDDFFVIQGVSVGDRIVLQGAGLIADGERVECEDGPADATAALHSPRAAAHPSH
jgi:membrane fusion protein (multidrug efflux system)